MNVLSVCSGIGAAELAFTRIGMSFVASSEIEAFPNTVRAVHFPGVPNWGDMTKFKEWPDADVDVLVGGTPCQSFSVAGLRKGLADPRGNLALTFLAIADRYAPRWILWENVPGVLSSGGGRDFGAFLGALAELGYGFAYRVLDAQFFGLAQRRKRVFVVGYLGDWRPAAAVLFERESLRGDPPPRRGKGQRVAGTLEARAGTGGYDPGAHGAASGHLIAIKGAAVGRQPENGPQRGDFLADGSCYTLMTNEVHAVAHSLRGEGFDASEDDTGRGTPLVPVAFDTTQITSASNYSNPRPGDPCHPLAAGAHAPAVFSIMPQNSGKDFNAREVDVAQPLMTNPVGGNQGGDYVIEPVVLMDQGGGVMNTTTDGLVGTLRRETHGHEPAIAHAMAVRRLTPRECERLQGFPDDYTNVPYRGKTAADGPRYKSLGNSMAVPCMAFIGRRIAMVDALLDEAALGAAELANKGESA